ncbi:tetratricopeptide repeat protein [Rhodanobacter koreensis]
MNVFPRVVFGLFFLTAALATPVFGQKYDTVAGPNGKPPAFTEGTHLADARPGQYFFNIGAYAFMHHDYVHAVRMYELAASWAYKPAEYNLAVMYARGQGTAVDLPRAIAWMRLAAERKNPVYLKAQTLIEANLKPGGAGKAEAIYKELESRYGDESAMRRAKNRWVEVQKGQTGSLTGHPIGPGYVGNPNGTHTTDSSLLYQELMASEDPYNTPTVTVGTLVPVKSDGIQTSKKPESSAQPKADQPLP